MDWLYVLLLLVLPMFFIQTSIADDRTLRCQGRLVSIGDTVSDVLDKCGEPDKVNQWKENQNSYISQIFDYEQDRYIAPKLVKGPIVVEHWKYDFGSTRFIRYLRFENGKLIKIESGEKGSN
jgi:hypothetical protein